MAESACETTSADAPPDPEPTNSNSATMRVYAGGVWDATMRRMALTTPLVQAGLHHAVSSGDIVAGAGFGEVAAIGANQLCRFLLPFDEKNWRLPGFAPQFYVFFKSIDGNVTNAIFDAQEFEADVSGDFQVARLRLDVAALPAQVQVWFEAHHSAGR